VPALRPGAAASSPLIDSGLATPAIRGLTTVHARTQVSLMLENGDVRDDLTLPTGTDDADKLAATLKADFAEGKEILVTVTKVSWTWGSKAASRERGGSSAGCLQQITCKGNNLSAWAAAGWDLA
jgi:hypothetical protein